jgi:hypothetical protein
MPEKETIERAREDKREGKAPTTQAGEFIREEVHHIREGKHGARHTKQAIAIGLSKARRSGVDLPPPQKGVRLREGPARARQAVCQTIARRRRRLEARRPLGGVARGPVEASQIQRRASQRRPPFRRCQEGGAHERTGRAFRRGTKGRANAGAVALNWSHLRIRSRGGSSRTHRSLNARAGSPSFETVPRTT